MTIIQSIPISGSGGSGSTYYTNMTTDEAIAGTNTEERVISAKVLNDAIDNKIPTVNNAELTIQKNGTTVKTFTANSSTNVTCNIEIPTKVSDLTNDSGFIADVSGKADKATTLSGYGITDAYTKTQIDKKVSDLVNSAPETLDTLNELASALGDDPNFATTVATQIGNKANDSDVVHKTGNESITGVKTFTSAGSGSAALLFKPGTLKKGDTTDGYVSRIYHGDAANYANALHIYETGTTDNGDRTYTNFVTVTNTAGISDTTNRTTLTINFHKNPSNGRKQTATLSGDFLPSAANTYNLGSESNPWGTLQAKTGVFTHNPMRKVTDYVHGETISSEYKGGGFQIVDKNNISMGVLESYYWKNGYNNTYLSVYNQDPNNRKNGRLGIAYDTTRDIFFGFCPTPPKSENSNAIATTEWVTAKGYLTSHQSLSNYSTLANTVKSISISGKTITVTPGSGDAYTLTTQDTTYSNFVKSGSGAKAGLVPSPGTTAGTTKYLREDGTWQVPPDHTYTVNNATLTIQKNGSNVATFTANSSTNKTANITVPTKVSELTNDSKFVNTTQLATKANDADVVHKSGDEDINGTKSFKTMPKIAGTYLGNEASTNERTCLYLTSNRDTIDKSGAYLVRFRQNRDQGALEGVSYISQDILENGTRYPRVLVSGLAFGSDFTPSYYYLSSQSSMPSQLGREDLPWSKAFLTDCSIGNTLEVEGDVWVGGDQLMITSDETEVFTGRRISWAKNAGTLPTKAYNLNFSLGGNNSAGWANRIGGFRVALNTTGDVETAMYAHDTTGASKGQGMIGIYYKRETDTYETIAPTPPAGDNSTQIATTAWVTAKDNNVVHKTGNETVKGVKTFTRDDSNAAIVLTHGSFKKGDASDVRVACLYTGDGTSYANSLNVYDVGTSDSGNITATSIMSIENTAGESGASKRTNLQIVYHKNPTDGRKQYATLSGDFLPLVANTYTLGNSSFKWKSIYGNLVGNADTATKATNNASGNELSNNIIKGLSVSGKVITYTKLDGSTGTITTQDTNTDTKVTNTLGNTTKAYITGTTSAKTNTGTQIFDSGVYLTTTAGQLHADIDFPITEAQVNEILGIA